MLPTSPAHLSIDRLISIEVRVVVFSLQNKQLQVLLTPATSEKNKTSWAIPGLPFTRHLSLEQTASECLASYGNRHESYLEQLYTYSSPDGGAISVVYFALIPQTALLSSPAGGPQAAQWMPLEPLPPLVDDHAGILQYALRRLRYKLEYTAVGFELLPENFSLSELQATYEIILGEKLDKRNFRRRILKSNIIEPTPHQRLGEGRPARLFRYRPDAVAEVKTRRLFP